MKQSALLLCFLIAGMVGIAQTQQPKVNVPLTIDQIRYLIKIIDDAKLDGDNRREAIKWLADPANAFLAKNQPKDSTKTKPPVKNEAVKKEGGKP